MPQAVQALRCCPARSSCICTIRFFFGSGLGELCVLWLRSDRISGADTLCLSLRLNSEKTGRLLVSGGGELSSAGDDGGDDRVGASEEGGGDGCGLELMVGIRVGGEVFDGAETRVGGEVLGDEAPVDEAFTIPGPDVKDIALPSSPTRLRLAHGSPSYSGRFCLAYVLPTFLADN